MLGGAFVETDLSDKQCDDLVMRTEELIPTFLALDPDNIVFKQPGSDNYLCSSREDIKTQMNDPANIVLPCIGSQHALHITPNLVCGLKMSKLQALGISYGGYVPLENIVNVIANSTEQVFQIEDYDSPITIKALAGLRLFPEYAPQQVQVPFYPDEDENNDSYVRRLNEWGAQNNEPSIGDRWEDASQLLLGATHCQSGYEGQHMYRIVSVSNPEYTVNPRLLKRMEDAGCIVAESLPIITDDTPQIDWQSEYLYQDTAEYTPARRLFDDSMEEEEVEQEEDKDVKEKIRDLLIQQLGSSHGIGPTLGEIITDIYPYSGLQNTLSLSGNTEDRTAIIKLINQSKPMDNNWTSTTTYVMAFTQPNASEESSLDLNYITNINGSYTGTVANYPNIIVFNLDNEEKRRKIQEVLVYLNNDSEIISEEIEDIVIRNSYELEVDVKPYLVVVGTVRPENIEERGKSTHVITILASDLLAALDLSQLEWDQWYYNNVVRRITDYTQTIFSPDNITLYAFNITNEGSVINIETSIWNPTSGSILAGDTFSVSLGYIQSITFPDSSSDVSNSMEERLNVAVLGDSISQEDDAASRFTQLLRDQLSDRDGMGVALAEAISGGIERGEQLTLSFSGDITERSSIISTINQNNAAFGDEEYSTDSYILGITEQTNNTDYYLTYLTNLDGALTSRVEGQRNILVMNIDDDTKRQKAFTILEQMAFDVNMKSEEIDNYANNSINNYELNVVVKPFLVVVATVLSQEQEERTTKTRIIAVLASQLLNVLQLSYSEWEQWFYKNVIGQLSNNSERLTTSDNVDLHVFDIYNEVNNINIETSIIKSTADSIVHGNNFVVNIGFMQVLRFPVLDSNEISVDGVEQQDGEMSSIFASPSQSQLNSPNLSFGSMSPIPMRDFIIDSPGEDDSSNTVSNLSGGKKRHQTKSKRASRGKKSATRKVKQTRRRKNNIN